MVKEIAAAVQAAVILFGAPGASSASPAPRENLAPRNSHGALLYTASDAALPPPDDGLSGGTLPDDTPLTWTQFLSLLSRSFAADEFRTRAEQQGFAAAAYQTALSNGFLGIPGRTSFTPNHPYTTPLTRQDAALLLSRVLPETGTTVPASDGGTETMTDFPQMDETHREAVSRLSAHGVLRDTDGGAFRPADTILYGEAADLLARTRNAVDNARAGEKRSVTVQLLNEHGLALLDETTVTASVGQSLTELAGTLAPDGYQGSYLATGHVSVFQDHYTLYVKPFTAAEFARQKAQSDLRRGKITAEAYNSADFWLRLKGDNEQKKILLFSDGNWERKQVYESAEQAAEFMETVSVPVWRLRNGVKSKGSMSITVHRALAQDVKQIFTEIFNDPEQFPMESIGGFRYVPGTNGEHNNGTAIDLNPDANYQVRDGVAETGTHWTPGADPLSIPVNGSVVRVFENHGWTWGGADWAGHADETTGYHDYMHFSYRGR